MQISVGRVVEGRKVREVGVIELVPAQKSKRPGGGRVQSYLFEQIGNSALQSVHQLLLALSGIASVHSVAFSAVGVIVTWDVEVG